MGRLGHDEPVGIKSSRNLRDSRYIRVDEIDTKQVQPFAKSHFPDHPCKLDDGSMPTRGRP
jgi:hypothetical protein